MIKIKNKILIYFIFYINNISFLRNEEKEQIPNQVPINEEEEQIQDYNNEERNSEQKNENIISKNEIKKYNLIFNNIFNKINKKNIGKKIIIGFSGIIFLFILYIIYIGKNEKKEEILEVPEILYPKIEEIEQQSKTKINTQQEQQIKKTEETLEVTEILETKIQINKQQEPEEIEKIKLIKDFISEEYKNIDIFISIDIDFLNNKVPSSKYIKIIKKDKFLKYLNQLLIEYSFTINRYNIFSFSIDNLKNEIEKIKNTNSTKKKCLLLEFLTCQKKEEISKFNSLNIKSYYEFSEIYDLFYFFIRFSTEKEKELDILNKIINDCILS